MIAEADLRTRAIRDVITDRRKFSASMLGLSAAAFARSGTLHAQTPEAVDGFRTVETILGEVTIPVNPQRVVVMENRVDLEIAVALELPIVGVGVYVGAFGTFEEYVNPWIPFTPGPEVTPFNTGEPDLEDILQLNPDLTISRLVYATGEFGYDGAVLNQIAPVIPVSIFEAEGGMLKWKEELATVAAFLDRTHLVDAAMAAYNQDVAETIERFGSQLGDLKLAVLRYSGDGEIFVNESSMFAAVLQDLGGSLVDLPLDETGAMSIERLDSLNAADGLLYWGDDADWAAVNELEIWQNLPVIKEDRFHQTTVMLNIGSIYAAREVVAQYRKLLEKLA